ncbi:MAG: hypothetical protein U1E20_15680 [Methylocystis sp.]|uniref:hypothetical protein n=1 Tax=Methylocystis sp. TaxID=1911079 RepID=UPI00396377FB
MKSFSRFFAAAILSAGLVAETSGVACAEDFSYWSGSSYGGDRVDYSARMGLGSAALGAASAHAIAPYYRMPDYNPVCSHWEPIWPLFPFLGYELVHVRC